MSASINTTAVQILNPKSNPSLAPSYSQISVVPLSATKRLINLAGQLGTHTSNTPEQNAALSLDQQNRLALASVDKLLEEVGAQKADVVSVRAYIVKLSSLSIDDVMTRGKGFLEWWKDGTEEGRLPPPVTLIGVESLMGRETLIEYEVQCVSDIN